MKKTIRILHLEDDSADAELVQAMLESTGSTCQITRAQTRDEFAQALSHGEYDVVLSDYNLPTYNGMSALRLTLEQCPDVPFIFVSGTMGEDAAIEALTEGAADYVLKQKLSRIVPAIERVLRDAENRKARKRAEEEREKLKEQLNQAQKMESIGKLAGGVAHDFNNMLYAILGHAEMALGKVAPSHPVHDDLLEIQKAANRSADLTRQLLAFARKQIIAPKVLDLNIAMTGMLKMLQRLIGEEINLVWKPGNNLWPVRMDPSQIDQILANLCVNARDAIEGVGTLTIATKNTVVNETDCASCEEFAPGQYIQLTVSDDGCGMNQATLERIFEPFFTTKEIGKGTGLGLPTIYGIVKQNKGFIRVHSDPGKGTTFHIYLPRHDGKPIDIREVRPITPAPHGHETILLVEDEQIVLNMTQKILENAGYRVLPAATPQEAIHMASEHPDDIHLLMTDMIMPEMTGLALAQELISRHPNLKLLFMSGYAANIIVRGNVLDANIHFIQKPFSIAALNAKLRNALDSR
jgi:signal transduction histidine kinase